MAPSAQTKMADVDKWIAIAKECKYLPESDLKVRSRVFSQCILEHERLEVKSAAGRVPESSDNASRRRSTGRLIPRLTPGWLSTPRWCPIFSSWPGVMALKGTGGGLIIVRGCFVTSKAMSVPPSAGCGA